MTTHSNRYIQLVFLCAALTCSWLPTAAAQPPKQLVEKTTVDILNTLSKEKAELKARPGRIYELIEETLLPHFDFVGMSRFVIGKHWRKANKSQQAAFVSAFRDLLVRTYAGALLAYTDQKVTFPSAKKGDIKPKKALIRSKIENPGGQPLLVNYRLWLKGNEWKVYDITVEGVSLLSNFRTQLTSEVSQYGIDATINKIHSRSANIDDKN